MTSITTQKQPPQPAEHALRDGYPQEDGVRAAAGVGFRVLAHGPSYRALNRPAGAAL
ncbi:hypothetical protein [Streptomyces sp. MH60]|uniref:hypothetical protein n=1 Tax=Streptomyces sp. MH60 TaxID=1940758 RepID=UPI000D4D4917|nr:hypothetical protein [Streptomyces sp. MH60]PPS90670.1 hypothetical protein BZZ08_00787 [Streptomyces sp. MH60]